MAQRKARDPKPDVADPLDGEDLIDGDDPLDGEDLIDGEILLDDQVPDWQRRSVERSLKSARARAQARSDRFVAAAVDLIQEERNDFTIQDVGDRSEMSLRTFYRFFDGKDTLLLAVYETILRKTAVPLLREACDKQSDPVERLRALLEAMTEATSTPHPLSRALSILHLRLSESRPDDLAHAVAPLRNLITELLADIQKAGRLRDDLDLTTQASLLQELLISSGHSAVLGGVRRASTAELWAFCSAAILRPAA
ncbi:MAG: transcriptional regulatory protein [Actinomycetia bacterium]|nr:transcriptional regulatory protein [Actinomycetes bacterium]